MWKAIHLMSEGRWEDSPDSFLRSVLFLQHGSPTGPWPPTKGCDCGYCRGVRELLPKLADV